MQWKWNEIEIVFVFILHHQEFIVFLPVSIFDVVIIADADDEAMATSKHVEWVFALMVYNTFLPVQCSAFIYLSNLFMVLQVMFEQAVVSLYQWLCFLNRLHFTKFSGN